MTSAAGAGAPASAVSADLFLPVEEAAFLRPFGRDEALRPQTVEPFLLRVPTSTRQVFEQGLAELQKANYAGAEVNFKRAIRPDVDSTSALAYLAASFAAAGRDAEAAGAWQTALVDGSDLPQIYEWLGETLARTHDFTAARSILEEAVGRWPSDTRFDRTLALSYATLGKGRDAIRTLDRYVADGRPEPDLLVLMVEWLYQAHSNGAVVQNGAGDLAHGAELRREVRDGQGPQAGARPAVGGLPGEREALAVSSQGASRPGLLERVLFRPRTLAGSPGRPCAPRVSSAAGRPPRAAPWTGEREARLRFVVPSSSAVGSLVGIGSLSTRSGSTAALVSSVLPGSASVGCVGAGSSSSTSAG